MPNRLATSLVAAVFSFSALCLHAQNRIAQDVSTDSVRVQIPNTINPRARLATDLGVVPASTPLTSVTVRFNMTTAQSAALDQLLSDQQNPASARYHQWLTPEAYGAQFGLSATDLATVTAYLQSQGLSVGSIARSHTFVTVSGTAAQVGKAFGTSIHAVTLNGEQHFANLTDPALPGPLANVTKGITGLNDFKLKPHVHSNQVLAPKFTSSTSGNHYLAPGDIYTIYDINPLLTSSINGAGITIAVMGQTDISLPSAAAFRAASGLSVNAPTVKVYGTDPGTSSTDLDEAMLDVEWSGAVAPAASILYVNSTDVIAGSLTQAIDNNLAPILTVSYGDCESGFGSANIAVFNSLFRQANAQGQTVVGPGGDSGATDCDYQSAVATGGLAVDFPASSPNVTAVGGTMFNEGAGTYFSTTDGAYQGSALSYIPEAVWNETIASGSLAAGGGGASSYFTKPAYQVGLGVPNDFARDVPDLSLAAAASHDGFLICAPSYCTTGYRNATGYLDVIGGTSIATPSFAGMLALVEQKIQGRIGNANPILYGLANSTYSSAVFHDITTGNNNSPCTAGTPNCPNGGSIGYNATTGYDLATGWGSVDAYNLVSDWLLATPAGLNSGIGQNASATTVTANVSSVVAGTAVSLKASVGSATNGISTAPTGTVRFLVDNVVVGGAVPLSGGSASYTLATGSLLSGAHTLTAAYSGDTTFGGSKGSLTLDVTSATAADFSLTPASSTVTASAGRNAPGITFTVNPLNGFTGNVAFNVTSTSSGLTASGVFSVSPVVITSSTTSGTTVLTLSAYLANGTTAGALGKTPIQSAAAAPSGAAPWRLAGSGLALAGVFCLLLPGRRNRWGGLLVALVMAGMLTVSGCGSSGTAAVSSQVNSTPGTYSLLVTATGTNASGGTITHHSTVTFVVQ